MSDSPAKENKPGSPAATAARKRRRVLGWLLVISLAILAAIGLSVIVAVVFSGDAGRDVAPARPEAGTGAPVEGKPVSILPPQPEGVTVLERLPAAVPGSPAPAAQGADLPSGFAMDLGQGLSFVELSRRFADIVETNGPDNFVRLEPRAVLRETLSGIEARLLVGPFETEQDAGEACEVLVLPGGISCEARPFEGELIARE